MIFYDAFTKKNKLESYAKVKHMDHIFTGKAVLHPDDPWSDFTGCRYAEMRGQIKALKYEYKIKKAKCEECRKFVKAVSQYKNFDKESSTAKAMYRQLNRRIKEVNKIADNITEKELNLKIAIRQQDAVHKKTKEVNVV